MPFTISGVDSNWYSGRGPRLSVLKRQATSSLLKLSPVIWSSGEYRVLRRSAPYVLHSPFFVPDCPVVGIVAQASRATAGTTRKPHRRTVRLMLPPFTMWSHPDASQRWHLDARLATFRKSCTSL